MTHWLDMLEVGESDELEAVYMASLKAQLAKYGLFINYEKDRAGLDLGLHLYRQSSDRKTHPSLTRVWMQAKSKHTSALSPEAYSAAESVTITLSLGHLLFWASAPEAVYLLVYIESADEFLAVEVGELVDTYGGVASHLQLASEGQKTKTVHINKTHTLGKAIDRMPTHRSMRIDGPGFRGRPLGHRYDPLRSELEPMRPNDYIALVDALLAAHDYRSSDWKDDGEFTSTGTLRAGLGTIHLTYEWTLQMFTEFGYGPNSDFRVESEPLHVHGEIAVLIDADPDEDRDCAAVLNSLLFEARERHIDKLLVFVNTSESSIRVATGWRLAAEGFYCWPQTLGSLSFNVLVTTNVYLDFLDRLRWKYVNYLPD